MKNFYLIKPGQGRYSQNIPPEKMFLENTYPPEFWARRSPHLPAHKVRRQIFRVFEDFSWIIQGNSGFFGDIFGIQRDFLGLIMINNWN